MEWYQGKFLSSSDSTMEEAVVQVVGVVVWRETVAVTGSQIVFWLDLGGGGGGRQRSLNLKTGDLAGVWLVPPSDCDI